MGAGASMGVHDHRSIDSALAAPKAAKPAPHREFFSPASQMRKAARSASGLCGSAEQPKSAAQGFVMCDLAKVRVDRIFNVPEKDAT